MSRRRFQTLLAACLVPLALAVHGLQQSIDGRRRIHFVDSAPVFLPNGKLLRWMSMGYPGLVGDWLWIRSVLYYGRRAMDDENPYYLYASRTRNLDAEMRAVRRDTVNRAGARRVSKWLPPNLARFENRGLMDDIYPLLDRVTTVDPHFLLPYIFGGVYVLMDTGDLDDAEALLKKGFRQNPDSWQMAFYLGWLSWAYRDDPAGSREYMIQAVGKPGCPPYVSSLLSGVTREADQVEITRSYLRSILESTENPDIRARIESVLESLESPKPAPAR
jgi:hypothetical protein